MNSPENNFGGREQEPSSVYKNIQNVIKNNPNLLATQKSDLLDRIEKAIIPVMLTNNLGISEKNLQDQESVHSEIASIRLQIQGLGQRVSLKDEQIEQLRLQLEEAKKEQDKPDKSDNEVIELLKIKLEVFQDFVKDLKELAESDEIEDEDEIHSDIEFIIEEVFRSLLNITTNDLLPLESRELNEIIKIHTKVLPVVYKDSIKSSIYDLEEELKEFEKNNN
ncbi:MAG TPA: hypothetical protein VIK81_03215 [Patescibacteria group bacterium]